MTKKVIFPVSRLHEPLSVKVEMENGKVSDAWVSGMMYRGFELMLEKRTPQDVILLSQRICGICSTAHSTASVYAIEDAYNLQATPNGRLLQNIIFGADILQNHIRHFYLLILPDYVKGPDTPPFEPVATTDYRLPANINSKIMSRYWTGAEMAAHAHQLLTIFGAKAPHQQTIFPTGVTVSPMAERVNMAMALASKIKEFIENFMLEDVDVLGKYYSDYYKLGVGYKNLMSFGMLPDVDGKLSAFPQGIIKNGGEVEPLKANLITEDITHAWYQDEEKIRRPVDGKTDAVTEKEQAYTWVKAPRYQGKGFEGGPLARAWMSGEYRRGISTMDRIVARCLEAHKVAKLILEWLSKLQPGQPTLEPYTEPKAGQGVGLTDAMRGCLGHWVKLKNGRTTHYQVVTPTAWNFSPRDSKGVRGPVEQALIGTPIEKQEELIEIGRVVRSYDPCFSCAVHLIRPEQDIRKFQIF